jgi:hypothetical protein
LRLQKNSELINSGSDQNSNSACQKSEFFNSELVNSGFHHNEKTKALFLVTRESLMGEFWVEQKYRIAKTVDF